MKYSIAVIIFLSSIICLAQSDTVEEIAPGEQIFTVTEIHPEFPGGHTALKNYLSTNLNYPKKDKKKGIEGTSYVEFTVNKDGTLSDINIVKGLSPACDAEGIRLVKKSPPWKPGKRNSKIITC